MWLLYRHGSLHRRRCKSSISKASASSPSAQVRYTSCRYGLRRIATPHTRDTHASIESASAYTVLMILRVSEDNIPHLGDVLRRSSSRERIHSDCSGGHHFPMEESTTGLSPKSIATSAGRTSSPILYIFIFNACLALYIAAFLCWNRLCTKAKCRHSLPSYQAYSPQAQRPDCCHNARCCDVSSCY